MENQTNQTTNASTSSGHGLGGTGPAGTSYSSGYSSCYSPGSMMDQMMSTPVTNNKRIRPDDERVNPFERHILHRLHEPMWSPSVLNCTNTSNGSADISMETPPQRNWAIDQISKLNPIRIEESPSTHQNETMLDAQSEAKVQAAISQFFSRTELIAPSPRSPFASPSKPKSSNKCTKNVNTDLSFPPILPESFEQFLYSFSNCNGSNNSSCSIISTSSKIYNSTTNAESNMNGHGLLGGLGLSNNNLFTINENSNGSTSSNNSQNSNSGGSGSNNDHPPTPPSSAAASSELNTSMLRRKLEFTFDMEYENCTDDEDEVDGVEGDINNMPITSIIESMESSHGRTLNSPDNSSLPI